MYNHLINIIHNNKNNFVNYNEIESNINQDCIINSICLMKYFKEMKIFKMPCSLLDEVYLYIDNTEKWILRIKQNNNFILYKLV
jgi:hypothetical protein